MAHTFYLVPSGAGVGLTSLALGLVRALDNRGLRVAFFKPIGQPLRNDVGPERSTYFIRATSPLRPATPVPFEEAEGLILRGRIFSSGIFGKSCVRSGSCDLIGQC